MGEEYTSDIIENTRRQMKILGYENVKAGMLESIMLTGTWLQLEDLKGFMPEKNYQELLKAIETKKRIKYSPERYPEISQEELEKSFQDDINGTAFVITKNDNNEYMIEEYFARERDKIIKSINIDEIDGAQLARAIATAMQRHLDYGTFHDNQFLSADEIEKELKNNIDRLKRQEIVFEQDGNQPKSKNEEEKKGSPTLLESAIDATKESTRSNTISEQAKQINNLSKEKDGKVEETEILK